VWLLFAGTVFEMKRVELESLGASVNSFQFSLIDLIICEFVFNFKGIFSCDWRRRSFCLIVHLLPEKQDEQFRSMNRQV